MKTNDLSVSASKREIHIYHLLALAAFESLFVILWLFLIPSEKESSFIFGLSKIRLMFVGTVGFLFIGLTASALILRKNESFTQVLYKKLDTWLINYKWLTGTIISWILMILGFIYIVWFCLLRLPNDIDLANRLAPTSFSMLYSVVSRLLPVLIWGIIGSIKLVIWLILRYWQYLCQKSFWKILDIIYPAATFLTIFLTLFHWGILVFQVRLFVNIPGWYWEIKPKVFSIRDIVIFIFLIAITAAGLWSLRSSRLFLVQLGLIYLLGVGLQIGFGYVEGAGLESLKTKFFSRYHSAYALKAAENNLSVIENIRNYEQIYGDSMFPRTKPPGLMAFYIGLERLVNGGHPEFSTEVRYQRLTNFITWTFPFISFLIIFVLTFFAARVLSEQAGFLIGKISGLFYTLAPNILLVVLFMDQAIYPVLFLSLIIFVIVVLRNQSLPLAFLLGFTLYLSIFFTFTALPILVFVGIYGGFDYWANRQEYNFWRRVQFFGMIGLGVITAYFVFYFALNYDFVTRFQKTVEINRNFDFYLRIGLQPPTAPVPLAERINQTVKAGVLNLIEFSTTIGFPIISLFLVQAARTLWRCLRMRVSQSDIILGSWLMTFILLNLAGTTQGEVGRLWMFWVPMIVILAARELIQIKQRRSWYLTAIVFLQIMTVFLTYHFQDLQM